MLARSLAYVWLAFPLGIALLDLASLGLAWLEFGRLSLLDLLGLAWQARSLEDARFSTALKQIL